MKIKRILTAAIVATMMITSLTACGDSDKQNNTATNVGVSDVETEETTEPDECKTGFTGYEYGNPIKDINYTFSSHVAITAEQVPSQLCDVEDVDAYLENKYRDYDIKIDSIKTYNSTSDDPEMCIVFSVTDRTTLHATPNLKKSFESFAPQLSQSGTTGAYRKDDVTYIDLDESSTEKKYTAQMRFNLLNFDDLVKLRLKDAPHDHCALYVEIDPSLYFEELN